MISVIIPLYNKEKYIRETLKSLENVPDVEVLVIDNNSTDKGVDICIEESKKNPSIRIIRQHEPGVSPTRNMGIYEAKGDYICFLDADDQYEKLQDIQPDRLGKPDIIVFGFKKIDNATNEVISEHQMNVDGDFSIEERPGEWLYRAVDNFIAYNVANKIYRTEFLRENGFLFEKEMDRLEDLSFFVRSFVKANQIVYSKAAKHLYRTNIEEGSLVHKVRKDFDYLQKAAEIYRNMESLYLEKCSEEQMVYLERGLYEVLTRELSIMRLHTSIKDNYGYIRKLKAVLNKEQKEKKCKVSITWPEYIKYILGTNFLLPLWLFTRLRWH